MQCIPPRRCISAQPFRRSRSTAIKRARRSFSLCFFAFTHARMHSRSCDATFLPSLLIISFSRRCARARQQHNIRPRSMRTMREISSALVRLLRNSTDNEADSRRIVIPASLESILTARVLAARKCDLIADHPTLFHARARARALSFLLFPSMTPVIADRRRYELIGRIDPHRPSLKTHSSRRVFARPSQLCRG